MSVSAACTMAVMLMVAIVHAENPEQWRRDAKAAVAAAKRLEPITSNAKNVILFVGDGMGLSTVTAARILEGQRRGRTGEENVLSFERLPYTALVKTYNTNQQVADSAGTITAIVTGVKTKAGVLSIDQVPDVGDIASAPAHKLTTLFELAERAGYATGIVTTSRVTHATPAACYAHSPDRVWEDTSRMPLHVVGAGFPDIARQLIEFADGDGIDVVFGGGRRHFLPRSVPDPEETPNTGWRRDRRNLTEEWLRRPGAAFVWNRRQFDALDPSTTRAALGLFSWSNMAYEYDRPHDKAGEPSLSEMTAKAIDLLARRGKGYVLMVEGGRIDHAHHEANAFRALTDTIEFARAVKVARKKTERRDTLIVVTADHSHVMTIAGHPTRGNPILGKVVKNDRFGRPKSGYAVDWTGLPYTTLSYANGAGYTGASSEQPEGPKHRPHTGRKYKGITTGRPDLTDVDTTDPEYLQECTVPMWLETHAGEDVPLYADGPFAHLFHGVIEQNVIFYVIVEAMGLTTR